MRVHREKGMEDYKAHEDAGRSVVRFSLHPRGYIRWSDCTLEYFVIPNLVSYRVIGKADDGVFTSFYLVVNVMEIGTCYSMLYLTYRAEVVLQMWVAFCW